MICQISGLTRPTKFLPKTENSGNEGELNVKIFRRRRNEEVNWTCLCKERI